MRYLLNNDYVDVKFTYTPGYAGTFWEPGSDPEAEIEHIYFNEVDVMPIISDHDFDAILNYIYENAGKDND
jgi:hypothetical protein